MLPDADGTLLARALPQLRHARFGERGVAEHLAAHFPVVQHAGLLHHGTSVVVPRHRGTAPEYDRKPLTSRIPDQLRVPVRIRTILRGRKSEATGAARRVEGYGPRKHAENQVRKACPAHIMPRDILGGCLTAGNTGSCRRSELQQLCDTVPQLAFRLPQWMKLAEAVIAPLRSALALVLKKYVYRFGKLTQDKDTHIIQRQSVRAERIRPGK